MEQQQQHRSFQLLYFFCLNLIWVNLLFDL